MATLWDVEVWRTSSVGALVAAVGNSEALSRGGILTDNGPTSNSASTPGPGGVGQVQCSRSMNP